eukprot:Sdes_comp10469_c0_seq1m2174
MSSRKPPRFMDTSTDSLPGHHRDPRPVALHSSSFILSGISICVGVLFFFHVTTLLKDPIAAVDSQDVRELISALVARKVKNHISAVESSQVFETHKKFP